MVVRPRVPVIIPVQVRIAGTVPPEPLHRCVASPLAGLPGGRRRRQQARVLLVELEQERDALGVVAELLPVCARNGEQRVVVAARFRGGARLFASRNVVVDPQRGPSGPFDLGQRAARALRG